jgi:hypothetical protein
MRMRMIRTFVFWLTTPVLLMQLAKAQAPVPAAPSASDPNLQFVDEVLRTAIAVQSLVKSMNLDKAFGAQSSYPAGDPRSLQRTAEFIGAGAGVGMALGEKSHGQKGAILGAAVGSAGGLIVDQVLRHQAAKSSPASANPPGSPNPPSH